MLLADDSTATVVANYLSAAGTIAAVAVALFLQVFLVRLRRPELQVFLSTRQEDGGVEAWKHRSTGYVICYLGVKVYAKRKKNAASNVRAMLLVVKRPDNSKVEGHIPPRSLDWANSGGSETVTIPSGTYRRLTLLRYLAAQNGDSEHLMPTTLYAPTRPYGDRYLLDEEGQYRYIFEISADGIDPSFWCLQFDHVKVAVERDEELLRRRLKNLHCRKLTLAEYSDLDGFTDSPKRS